jgi:hypothetical protein
MKSLKIHINTILAIQSGDQPINELLKLIAGRRKEEGHPLTTHL